MIESIKQFDAAIVGGGVIGCAIAWKLSQAGMSVVVLERGEAGREASQAAGGMLAPLAEADEADDFFHLAVASRAMYADFARELQEASGIDIEYRTEGTLYLALSEGDEEELDRRWQWQHTAGLNAKRLSAGCARQLEPHLNEKIRFALKFPDDHQVNNRLLVAALLDAANRSGVRFLTQTEVTKLIVETRAGRKLIAGVKTTHDEIKAGCVIVAAGSWSSSLAFDDEHPLNHFNVEPVRGQMVAIEMQGMSVRHVIYSPRGYLVPRLGGFLIAGSTTETVGYDRRVTAGGIASIIGRAAEILPGISGQAIIEMWAGLRPRATDGLPILGIDPLVTGLIYATGHYRNGILLTPITARAISEMIVKGESRIDLAPFSVARFAHRQAAG